MRFSIIIPAYNTEKQIEQCLRSICSQDFPCNRYEVIVVDDCSPDNLSAIVHRLQIEYPNIIYIRHDVNKRQGGARNTALRIAEGDYIFFVDSDDCWIYSNILTIFNNLLSNSDCDIVQTYNYKSINNETNKVLSKYDGFISYKDTNGKDYLMSDSMSFAVWLSCYNREFLMENNLLFEENVVYEDVDWRMKVCYFAQNVRCFDFCYYGYRQTEDSTTRNPSIKSFIDNIRAIERSDKFISLQNMTGDILISCRNRVKTSIISFIKLSRNYSIKDSIYCFDFLRKTELLHLKKYKLRIWEKIVIIAIKYAPSLLIVPIKILTISKRLICSIL